jgi:hypothetical protein
MRANWNWKWAATIAVLVASLGLNIWFVAMLDRAFHDLQFARVFPLGGLAQAQSAAAAASDARPSLAIYGDSRALLWDTGALADRFRVVNLARGAQTSWQLLLQLESQPHVASDWAIVEIGINDLHPLGVLVRERPVILDGLDRNLAAIVDQLLERSSCVVVVTIVAPGQVPMMRRLLWDAATLDGLARANRHIAELGKSARVVVLDGDGLLRDNGGYLPDEYVSQDSFLHINARAYDRLNRELLHILVNTRGEVEPGAGVVSGDNPGSRLGSSCKSGTKG